ncbi:MAG: hypothetical protein DWI58_12395 [Chloroflexi bacterium]|nr:MAG: hypothetical protein DWI58_12395 [Chloroflexota bacterium]
MSQINLGAILTGLAFAAAGVLFLLHDRGVILLRTELVIPCVVIALGLAAILGALTRRNRTPS